MDMEAYAKMCCGMTHAVESTAERMKRRIRDVLQKEVVRETEADEELFQQVLDVIKHVN